MNNLVTFNFTDTIIKTAILNNEPYFCLKDCAKALGIKGCTDRSFEKGAENISTLTNGGVQKTTFINEPNLYRLVFRSRKPQAQAFADWVYSEVLPAIRKNGGYNLPMVNIKSFNGTVKSCITDVIKRELSEIFNKPTIPDLIRTYEPLSDEDMLRCLRNWYFGHHYKSVKEQRRLFEENALLRSKLDTIRKTAD